MRWESEPLPPVTCCDFVDSEIVQAVETLYFIGNRITTTRARLDMTRRCSPYHVVNCYSPTDRCSSPKLPIARCVMQNIVYCLHCAAAANTYTRRHIILMNNVKPFLVHCNYDFKINVFVSAFAGTRTAGRVLSVILY